MVGKKVKDKIADRKRTAIPKKIYLLPLMSFFIFIFGVALGAGVVYFIKDKAEIPVASAERESYWLLLHRKSNKEFLYYGVPAEHAKSRLIREFTVKTGTPGQKPTPLPELLGRKYFRLIAKMDSSSDPNTSPYFLTLDIPVTDLEPFGPADYPECEDGCNWELPGYFGLHGVGGDNSKLSNEDPGSSGCIRHSDEDISFLYNILEPNREEIRYYIKDI